MSESLITDWSRSFRYCEDGRSLPLAWLREGWRDPPAQLGFQGPPCTAGRLGCLMAWVAMEVTAARPGWAGGGSWFHLSSPTQGASPRKDDDYK